MNQRKEARYQRAVERNLLGAERYEMRARKMREHGGRPLQGMTIEAAAHRLGIRLADTRPSIRNRIIDLIN